MSDTRTPEQKAASDALLEAIQQVIRLRDYDPDEGECDPSQNVVTDFVVVAACNSFDLMERGAAQYGYITRNDGQGHDAAPLHTIIGLLHMGLGWFEQ